MTMRVRIFVISLMCLFLTATSWGDSLETGFRHPPPDTGIRCWWWWLNSNVTKDAITRDLEAMRDKGFSGALIYDANGANAGGNLPVPGGPTFASEKWVELFKHAIKEADRSGVELGMSIQSGYDLGGPDVTLEMAAKTLTWSEIELTGPTSYAKTLPEPKSKEAYYRDIAVLAYRVKKDGTAGRKPIRDLALKSSFSELGLSAPDCRFLLDDHPAEAGEADTAVEEILNLTNKLSPSGRLSWDIPAGKWCILRFGYTYNGSVVHMPSQGWNGRVLDYLSREAISLYLDQVVVPLFEAIGPAAGTTIKHLQTDSFEAGGMNWTEHFPQEFKKYRGYDPIPYLPVIAGKIVQDRQTSNSFLADFRKTISDCIANNHYQVFSDFARKYNTGIMPEAGGPHAGPFDGMKNLGRNDEIVMSEFWSPSPHRPEPVDRFFVKQASSVAHIYGKKLIGAESFTTVGPHWNDVLWRLQKPSFDHEVCSGLNLVYLHTFVCSPKNMGIPGQEYFAGTHFNPQVTWWNYSDGFFGYLNRCQYLLQQGRFVAQVLYYYGDHVPNIARLKEDDPAKVLPGYDYDVTNEEILLRLKVVDGEILAPSGIGYRLLVLPDHKVLSLETLEKVNELLNQGATVFGPKPERLVSLSGGKRAQVRFKELADSIWGLSPGAIGRTRHGRGTIFWGQTGRQVLQEMDVPTDFEVRSLAAAPLDYIHYVIQNADVYFVCNQSGEPIELTCSFRIDGRQPELWDPVAGQIRDAQAFCQKEHRTDIPLRFTPYGSMFVVFQRQISASTHGTKTSNVTDDEVVQTLKGPWQVDFDPAWGGPGQVEFNDLISWTSSLEKGIRFYSGTATYQNSFTLTHTEGCRYWLDLGDVVDVGISRVWLNDVDLGVIWTKPFRVEMTSALMPGTNKLKVEVVNSWRNRLVGDRDLPTAKRYTKTNITIRKDWKLLDSGLLGPVKILKEKITVSR